MDYKKAYESTFEQLFLLQQQMTEAEIKVSKTLNTATKLGNVITTLHNSAEQSIGERKEKAEKILRDLVAVYNHIGQLYLSEMLAHKRNYDLNKNILELSKNTGVKRIFFSSSSEVYGEPVELPQNEHTTPLNSRLPYAIVKNVGEAFFKSYQQEFGLDYTIFRFFNTYGPKQSPDFVMSKFIKSALNNKDITIYGDGSQTRTFCYIDDNINACVNAFENNNFINDVLNIGNDNEVTILELANTIIKLTKSSSQVVHLPPLKDGDMTRRRPDTTKMKQLLNNRKLVSLEEGLKRVIANHTLIK
jgi:UDP-glucose 4-epimerase